MDTSAAIGMLGALAQPTRLEAFRRLVAALPGDLAAGAVAEACGVPHNTMSTHLGVLSRAGLATPAREGRSIRYRADIAGVRSLIGYLTRDCCAGRPEVCGDALARDINNAAPEGGGNPHA